MCKHLEKGPCKLIGITRPLMPRSRGPKLWALVLEIFSLYPLICCNYTSLINDFKALTLANSFIFLLNQRKKKKKKKRMLWNMLNYHWCRSNMYANYRALFNKLFVIIWNWILYLIYFLIHSFLKNFQLMKWQPVIGLQKKNKT